MATTLTTPVRWGFRPYGNNHGGPWHLITNGPAYTRRQTACGRSLAGDLEVIAQPTPPTDGPTCRMCARIASENPTTT